MQSNNPLVHASRISKRGEGTKPPGDAIFDNMTVTLPTDRVCAVLGHPDSGRTTFLRLLNGTERPDSGAILTETRFSIVCNDIVFFQPGMTGIENVKLAARLYGIDSDMLTEMTLSVSNFGADWQALAGSLPRQQQKEMELIVAALLPFDCYLVDDVERLDSKTLTLVLEILRSRNAGIIFATRMPKLVRQIATFCGVIANQTVYAFDSVDEALKNYV